MTADHKVDCHYLQLLVAEWLAYAQVRYPCDQRNPTLGNNLNQSRCAYL